NPRRTGLLHVLRAMGADIEETPVGEQGGEPVSDLHVRHAPLRGIEGPVEHVPDMIDEFPALFIAAAPAEGATVVRGAAELRVKEPDRSAAMAAGPRTRGARVDGSADGGAIPRGAPPGAGGADPRRGAAPRRGQRGHLVPRLGRAGARGGIRAAYRAMTPRAGRRTRPRGARVTGGRGGSPPAPGRLTRPACHRAWPARRSSCALPVRRRGRVRVNRCAGPR